VLLKLVWGMKNKVKTCLSIFVWEDMSKLLLRGLFISVKNIQKSETWLRSVFTFVLKEAEVIHKEVLFIQ